MQRQHIEEYKKLGLNISYYRKLKKLSQMTLAEKVGISRTHMSRIETAECPPSLEVVLSIAKVLDVEAYKLFEFK